MWKLAIEDDEGKRIVLPLTLDQYSIGRKDGNTIRLTERNVSREHARLYKKNGGGGPKRPDDGEKGEFVVEDLTSYNGVFVNGLRVTHAQPSRTATSSRSGTTASSSRTRARPTRPPRGQAPWAATSKETIPGVPNPRAAAQLSKPNRLIMLAGPAPGSEFPLEAERLTIGRAEEAGISVNHNSVSRIHCEVHALGDGRFEIIDKASSNGVRVNSTDLKRGIIEPGDVIELGDVQFKFVAAGQIFRPSQAPPLAALGNREAVDTFSTRRRATALPIAIFAVVVAAGTVGAWVFTRRAPEPHASAANTSAAPSPDRVALDEAKALCAAGDCESAHAKLEGAIADTSPLRSSPDFKDIEGRWADQLLQRADSDSDPAAKRALYQKVSQEMSLDSTRRTAAADRLQQLESVSNGLPPPTQLAAASAKAHPDEAAPTSTHETTRHMAVAEAAPQSAPAPAPQASPAPAPRTGGGSADDRERQLALQGTPDAKALLKQQLEQRMTAGKASETEIRLLVSTCKDLGDRSCVQSARAALARLQQQ